MVIEASIEAWNETIHSEQKIDEYFIQTKAREKNIHKRETSNRKPTTSEIVHLINQNPRICCFPSNKTNLKLTASTGGDTAGVDAPCPIL